MKTIKNIIFLLVLSLVSAINLSAHGDSGAYNHNWHNDKPYNTGSGLNNSATWMSAISDNVYLSQLALPGTHDSATGVDDKQNGESCRTQPFGATITNQLKAGIRVLDLRIFLHNGVVHTRHGNTNLCGPYITLNDIIKEVNTFLTSTGKSEVLILMISHESTDKVSNELKDKTINIVKNSAQFYNIPYFNSPTIGGLRGKFIVFARDDAFDDLGLSYKVITLHQIRNIFTNQDFHNMKTNWDVTYKWTAIKEH